MAKHLLRSMLSLVGLVVLTFGPKAFAATYYIDFANGLDSQSGNSINSPWKHHPFMQGWRGQYRHTPGDRFIFKGGVTWDSSCWRMTIAAGGTNAIRDYYGVDESWYSGVSWSRPIFDGELAFLPTSGHMVVINASYLTIDNIEFKNLMVASANRGGASFIANGGKSYVTITNCYLHAWTIVRWAISSISRDSIGQVTVTTTAPHDFAAGLKVIISGVANSSFNSPIETAPIVVSSGK